MRWDHDHLLINHMHAGLLASVTVHTSTCTNSRREKPTGTPNIPIRPTGPAGFHKSQAGRPIGVDTIDVAQRCQSTTVRGGVVRTRVRRQRGVAGYS